MFWYIMLALIMLGALIVLVLWIADKICEVAEIKGFAGGSYFWLAIWLPLLAAILVAGLPDRGGDRPASMPDRGGNCPDSAPDGRGTGAAIPRSKAEEPPPPPHDLEAMAREREQWAHKARVKRILCGVTIFGMFVGGIVWMLCTH